MYKHFLDDWWFFSQNCWEFVTAYFWTIIFSIVPLSSKAGQASLDVTNISYKQTIKGFFVCYCIAIKHTLSKIPTISTFTHSFVNSSLACPAYDENRTNETTLGNKMIFFHVMAFFWKFVKSSRSPWHLLSISMFIPRTNGNVHLLRNIYLIKAFH